MKCERMRASTVPCRFWHKCGDHFGQPSFGFWFAFWVRYSVATETGSGGDGNIPYFIVMGPLSFIHHRYNKLKVEERAKSSFVFGGQQVERLLQEREPPQLQRALERLALREGQRITWCGFEFGFGFGFGLGLGFGFGFGLGLGLGLGLPVAQKKPKAPPSPPVLPTVRSIT